MEYTIIVRYFQEEASDEEKEELFKWIEESPSNKEEFVKLKKTWALTSKSNEDLSIAWSSFNLFSPNQRKQTFGYNLLRYAALFIVLFSMGALTHYFVSQYIQSPTSIYSKSYSVKSPLGQMADLELPDGTVVLLNSGSSLSYSSDFSYGNREVTLEGEAFFDVTKDVSNPFIVRSELLDVKVYGTSFNIEAYPEDMRFKATLVEGSVSVLNKSGEEITMLNPGEKASYNKNKGELLIERVDTDIYTSWKDGLITFRNEKLADIARRIERWYNVEIVILNKDLGDELYFGTILKNKPIDQILEVLKLTTSLEYEIVTRPDKPTLINWY